MGFKQFFIGTIFDLSKRQNATFWVSQLAIILSTVLGVYLAASAGFKTAINFHSVVSNEKNFYTLSALREEVQSNNTLILDFAEKNFVFAEDGTIKSYKGSRFPELSWFVWVTMTNATETLELPVDILKDTNRYYIDVVKEINHYEKYGGYDKLRAASNVYQLAKQTDEVLLKRMEDKINDYRSRFMDHKAVDNL